MLGKLLILGAAVAGGIYLATRYSGGESEPDVPPGTPEPPEPPPGVINLSTASSSADFSLSGQPDSDDVIWVTSVAIKPGEPDKTFSDLRRFSNLADARFYFDAISSYFEKYHSWWTCPNGFAWANMQGFVGGGYIQVFDETHWYCESGMAQAPSSSPPAPPSAANDMDTIPLYVVSITMTGASDYQETFVVSSDAQAEVYYRMLKAFFDQPAIRKAYTTPVGTIVLLKYGARGAQSRSIVYDQNGVVGELTG